MIEEEKFLRKIEEMDKRIKLVEEKLGINEKKERTISESDLSIDNLNLVNKEITFFSKEWGVKEEKLKENIDFQEDLPRLMNIPKEKIRTVLQFKSLMILGLIYIKIYKKNINSSRIKNLFERSRIPLDRFDKLYISPLFRKYFTKINNEIKFSWAGEQEAQKLLKEYISR